MYNSLDFNIDHGFLEGIVRGMRTGILKTTDYINLVQCDSLEDLKLHLSGTDYTGLFSQESTELTVGHIDTKVRERLVMEFQHLRNHAVPPLATFLDFITYGYMIDNVILLLTGTIHERPISEMMHRCHPLGSFEQMEAVCIASTVDELYSAVLIDTPIANYFLDCITEQDITEIDLEIIRNMLYKAYLEDFYAFSMTLGETTSEIMGEILAFEADRRAFMITINSLGTEMTHADRTKLYPTCGLLYPSGLVMLATCEDYEQVRAVSEHYVKYRPMFEEVGDNSGTKTLEDKFFEYEVNLMKLSFINQFHFAVFYAYLRLREQENRNITWIAECIQQHSKTKIENYIPTF